MTHFLNCQFCVTETVAWVEGVCEYVLAEITSCPGCDMNIDDIDADHAEDCSWVKELRDFFIGSITASVLPATFVVGAGSEQLFLCQKHWLKEELEL